MQENKPVVAILMGSNSDWDVMKNAAEMLQSFDVPFEAKVVSAHRMPDEMFEYAERPRPRHPCDYCRRRPVLLTFPACSLLRQRCPSAVFPSRAAT